MYKLIPGRYRALLLAGDFLHEHTTAFCEHTSLGCNNYKFIIEFSGQNCFVFDAQLSRSHQQSLRGHRGESVQRLEAEEMEHKRRNRDRIFGFVGYKRERRQGNKGKFGMFTKKIRVGSLAR